VAKIASDSIQTLLASIEPSSSILCINTQWTECAFVGESRILSRYFDRNVYATSNEKTLGLLSRTIFFQKLGDWLAVKSENRPSESLNETTPNKLLSLIPKIIDSGSLIQSILARIQERPVEKSSLIENLKPYATSGLEDLLNLASEVLPDRRIAPRSHVATSSSLDGTGIASLIYTYDRVRSMNPRTIQGLGIPIRAHGSDQWVIRKTFMNALAPLLKQDFPRIHEACLNFGFSRTCGIVFDEILSDPEPGREDLEVHDLDIVPFAGIIFERLYHHCDLNQDALLSSNRILNEKKCVVEIAARVAQGLIKAGFIKTEPRVQRLLNLTQKFFAASWTAQAALSQGSFRHLRWYSVPSSRIFRNPASAGSLLSLLAEIMAPEKAAAIDTGSSTDGQEG
jgi:hypothetical protein